MIHAMAKISLDTTTCRQDRRVYNALLEACHVHGLRVLGTTKHEFHPQGLTAVVLLSESHAAIHTFPEWGIILVDVFTCRAGFDPIVVCDTFASLLGGKLTAGTLTDRMAGQKPPPMVRD